MISRLHLLFSMFVFISLITGLLFVVSWFLTRKFNNNHRNIYALFIDVNRSITVLYATIFLNFLLTIFFVIFIDKYDYFGMYMIIATSIVSCIVSFNYKIIINNIIHTFISVELLWLLSVINNYLYFVVFDTKILVLKYLFMAMIIVYISFVMIRRVELSLRVNNKIRR